jgi:hypothetical protein
MPAGQFSCFISIAWHRENDRNVALCFRYWSGWSQKKNVHCDFNDSENVQMTECIRLLLINSSPGGIAFNSGLKEHPRQCVVRDWTKCKLDLPVRRSNVNRHKVWASLLLGPHHNTTVECIWSNWDDRIRNRNWPQWTMREAGSFNMSQSRVRLKY